MGWDDMAVVGRIARAHGIRGQVIVNLETDFPGERFRPGAQLFVRRGDVVERLNVTSVRFQHDRPVIGVDGVDTMTDAEALAGLELRVPADQLLPLPDGTYYHHDLIGCRVETTDGKPIGVVSGVEGPLSGSRLVVDGGRGEILIPLASQICVEVDVTARRIVVAAPEGLLDLNR
jgi:16S rRNA processing protein RimM